MVVTMGMATPASSSPAAAQRSATADRPLPGEHDATGGRMRVLGQATPDKRGRPAPRTALQHVKAETATCCFASWSPMLEGLTGCPPDQPLRCP